MKARVKYNNEIIDVIQVGTKTHLFDLNNVEFLDNPQDYWTRLEHTYAGMAMQEILRGCGDYYELTKLASCAHEHRAESIAEVSRIYAHALVEKMKEAKA